jgi:hypothetical protein
MEKQRFLASFFFLSRSQVTRIGVLRRGWGRTGNPGVRAIAR